MFTCVFQENKLPKVKKPIKSILSKGKRTGNAANQGSYNTRHSLSIETPSVPVPIHTSDDTVCQTASSLSSNNMAVKRTEESNETSKDASLCSGEQKRDNQICSGEQTQKQSDSATATPAVEDGNQPKDPGKQSLTSSEEEENQCSHSSSGGDQESESHPVAVFILNHILENVSCPGFLFSPLVVDVYSVELLFIDWGGWGCEVSCGGHHRPRGKTTTGSALDGAVFDIAQILAYLVHNMSRSQLYLGFGHFV